MIGRNAIGCGLLLLAGCSPDAPTSAPANDQQPAAQNAPAPLPPVSAPSSKPAGRVSSFTKLTEAVCRLVEENKDEGPYWRRNCPGHAGWRMEWSESDLRQDLTMIAPGGGTSELGLSSVVANGAFNSIGETIEWRGRDARTPVVMVLRMNVAAGPDGDRPDISRLVVVRLTGTPCAVAMIEPGPQQSQRARDIADGQLPACLTASR